MFCRSMLSVLGRERAGNCGGKAGDGITAGAYRQNAMTRTCDARLRLFQTKGLSGEISGTSSSVTRLSGNSSPGRDEYMLARSKLGSHETCPPISAQKQSPTIEPRFALAELHFGFHRAPGRRTACATRARNTPQTRLDASRAVDRRSRVRRHCGRTRWTCLRHHRLDRIRSPDSSKQRI
jgi:hypothetical protein